MHRCLALYSVIPVLLLPPKRLIILDNVLRLYLIVIDPGEALRGASESYVYLLGNTHSGLQEDVHFFPQCVVVFTVLLRRTVDSQQIRIQIVKMLIEFFHGWAEVVRKFRVLFPQGLQVDLCLRTKVFFHVIDGAGELIARYFLFWRFSWSVRARPGTCGRYFVIFFSIRTASGSVSSMGLCVMCVLACAQGINSRVLMQGMGIEY